MSTIDLISKAKLFFRPVKAVASLSILALILLSCVSNPSVGQSPPQSDGAVGPFTPVAQLYDPRGGQRVQAGATIDSHIISPKSVNFTQDGRKVYINALEGLETLVYSFPDLKLIRAIDHDFTASESGYFQNGETTVFDYPYHHRRDSKDKNVFSGKPVEGTFSHNDRYFWVPYYRRSYDTNASGPSAMAIIDTESDRIVRVMPTGPLPKMVAASPDGRLLAVTHWGDNTVGLIDITSPDPQDFKFTKHLVVESKLNTAGLTGNRDSNCGLCLRGTVFTPDSRHLLVGRMAGGGIAVFAIPSGEYLGSFRDFSPTPRHLIIDPSGQYLYASDSKSGMVARVKLSEALKSLTANPGKSVAGPKGERLNVGVRPRTIHLSPDGKQLYASVHGDSLLIRVDTDSWKVADSIKVSPFPVGLGVSPDGAYVAITSQGGLSKGSNPPSYTGGNSVEFFRVK
jgi:DNA-binding beta-propeller fold protein YncE